MRSTSPRHSSLALAAIVAGLALAACRGNQLPGEQVACHFGAYELPDGQMLAIRHRGADALRYVFTDGRTAVLNPGRGQRRYVAEQNGESPAMSVTFGHCTDDRAWIALGDHAAVEALRVPLEQREVRFDSSGTELIGRLYLPPGDEPVPVAVLVHGSEDYSGIYGYHWQYLLGAEGIGAFVYDKRGTGRSGGEYTQDFEVLAADAVAAAREVRAIAGPRIATLGYLGGSQAGWVAPLAALRGGADFVVVGYGMAEGPLAEDREEVMRELRAAGYTADVLMQARELTDATGAIVASGFESGWEALAEVKQRYRREAWFALIRGEYTGDLLRWPGWIARIFAPLYDRGTTWSYEPMPTLAALEMPQLWILAGDDHEAPSATTLALLRELQADNPDLDVVVFPEADHGIIVGERDASGTLRHWRYAAGYQALFIEWIRTHEVVPVTDTMVVYDRGDPRLTPKSDAGAEARSNIEG
jgi:pimeloyl-ACP methyl ester carboxylesterase